MFAVLKLQGQERISQKTLVKWDIIKLLNIALVADTGIESQTIPQHLITTLYRVCTCMLAIVLQ